MAISKSLAPRTATTYWATAYADLARESNSFTLPLRYKAQAERYFRRAIEEFDRLKALREELPIEPIIESQAQQKETTSSAFQTDPLAPENPSALAAAAGPRFRRGIALHGGVSAGASWKSATNAVRARTARTISRCTPMPRPRLILRAGGDRRDIYLSLKSEQRDGDLWKRLVRPSAGINRHAVGDERSLQERSSEPPGLAFCGAGCEAGAEA